MSCIRSSVIGAAMCVAASGIFFGIVSTPAYAETVYTYYLTQDPSGTLGGNLTPPADYGTITVEAVGSNLQFDLELTPNWNVQTGRHYAVAFDLSTSGLTIDGLSSPYSQVTTGLPDSNPPFDGPFNYAITCSGGGSGQNTCNDTQSLIFDVAGASGLLPLLVGTKNPAYFAVDIFSTLVEGGNTGVVGANTFTTTTTQLTTPLPATLPLFLSGAGLLGFFCWRKKQQKSGAVA